MTDALDLDQAEAAYAEVMEYTEQVTDSDG
jgi:hypothetical protein